MTSPVQPADAATRIRPTGTGGCGTRVRSTGSFATQSRWVVRETLPSGLLRPPRLRVMSLVHHLNISAAIVVFGARGSRTGHHGMNIFLLSGSWHERIIYRASGVMLFLCGHGKGRRDQQHIICEYPLVTAAWPAGAEGHGDAAADDDCDDPSQNHDRLGADGPAGCI